MNNVQAEAILKRTRLLADLLVTDVQDYQPRIDAIAAALAQLQAGDATGHHGFGGNVYQLTLTAAHATIANARDRTVSPETLPLADFECAFRAWADAHRARG